MMDKPPVFGALSIPLPRPDPRQWQDFAAQLPFLRPSTPIPKPDPRMWADRLPRIQNSLQDPENNVFSPEDFFRSMGIETTRKNGDAIDYRANDIMRGLIYGVGPWKI